jgi:hypothetical protein
MDFSSIILNLKNYHNKCRRRIWDIGVYIYEKDKMIYMHGADNVDRLFELKTEDILADDWLVKL